MTDTPEQRALRARLASHTFWANTADRTAATAAARAAGPGQLAYWEAKVDPDRTMAPAERSRRAEHAKKAHFTRLALKSSKARQARSARPRPSTA